MTRNTVPRLDPTAGAEVRELLQANKSIEAIRRIRQLTGADLAAAKGAYLHFARLPGTCHRCSGSLPPGDVVRCGHCGSLNLDPTSTASDDSR